MLTQRNISEIRALMNDLTIDVQQGIHEPLSESLWSWDRLVLVCRSLFTALDEYVWKDDGKFSWKLVETYDDFVNVKEWLLRVSLCSSLTDFNSVLVIV